MEQGDLEFTPGALQAVASLARKRGTGARGLRSVIEDLMRDIIFEAGGTGLKELKVVVDEDRVLALTSDSQPTPVAKASDQEDEKSAAEVLPQVDSDGEAPEAPEAPDDSGETAAHLVSGR